MKRATSFVACVVAAVLAAGCGVKDTSRAIVCDVNGKAIPTAFTFDSFHKTLMDEHGKVEAKQDAYLKSGAVEIYFRLLGDGRLLAERVVMVRTGKELSPAVLFGVAETVEAPPAATESWRSNVIERPASSVPDATAPAPAAAPK